MTDTATDPVVDVAFRLPGGRLPVDHAHALFRAVSAVLPWVADDAITRIHQIHTAATGSGWTRPEASSGEELHLSRRTRLRLRVPGRRAGEALTLSGCQMDIDGYALTPRAGSIVPLVPAPTLLARHLVCEEDEEESRFIPRVESTLREAGISGAALLCGRRSRIETPEGAVHTRSVVVTNLEPIGAMSLLRNGFGPAGKLGCGIFIPYKRID